MNPAHRDGWPQTQASVSGPAQQQTEQGSGQGPRPLGSFGYVLFPLLQAEQDSMDQVAVELPRTPLFIGSHADIGGIHRTNNVTQQPSSHASPAQGAGPVLPPPGTQHTMASGADSMLNRHTGGPFYSSSAASAHNQSLPALAGLTGPPQHSPHQPSQKPPTEPASSAPTMQGAPQGPSYSLPGLGQALQQPQMQPGGQGNVDREREMREREARERELMESHAAQQHAAQQEELVKREAEQREREIRERQQHEQTAHENHQGSIQIHQPVAVAPSTRTIHGPNGLLGQLGPLSGPNAPAGIFGGAPLQQGETTPRMQHAVQPPPPPQQAQATMLMPFGGPGPMAMGQGQQPILNVSPQQLRDVSAFEY